MKAVLAFVDALGWHYLDHGMEFLDGDLREIGPVRSGMGFSSSIIPSIWSGQAPDRTGVWTEYRLVRQPGRDIVTPRTIRGAPFINAARLVGFRLTRRAGMPAMHRLRLPLEYSHLLQRNVIHYDRFPPADLPVTTLADDLDAHAERRQFQFFEARADVGLALRRVEAETPSVLIYHLAGLDGATHRHGPRPEVARRQLETFEVLLRDSVAAMSHGSDEVVLAVFSDHGMAQVQSTHDLLRELQPLKMGRDFVSVMDTTLARFWVDTLTQADRLRSALETLPWGSVLTDADRLNYGLCFPDDSYGQIVYVANEGCVIYPNFISPTLFRGASFPDRGVHGFRPESPSASGVFGYASSQRITLPTDVLQIRSALAELLWGP